MKKPGVVSLLAVIVVLSLLAGGYVANRFICERFGYFYGEQNRAAALVASSDFLMSEVLIDDITYIPATRLFGPSYASVNLTLPSPLPTEEEVKEAATVVCGLGGPVVGVSVRFGLVDSSWGCSDEGRAKYRGLDASLSELLELNERLVKLFNGGEMVEGPLAAKASHVFRPNIETEDFLTFMESPEGQEFLEKANEIYEADLTFSLEGLPVVSVEDWPPGTGEVLKALAAEIVYLSEFGGALYYSEDASSSAKDADLALYGSIFNDEPYVNTLGTSYYERLEGRTCLIG